MKKILISSAILAVSVVATISVNSNSKFDACFEANIEALAMDEGQSNNERVWDVDVKDKYSITCTLGGRRRCK